MLINSSPMERTVIISYIDLSNFTNVIFIYLTYDLQPTISELYSHSGSESHGFTLTKPVPSRHYVGVSIPNLEKIEAALKNAFTRMDIILYTCT